MGWPPKWKAVSKSVETFVKDLSSHELLTVNFPSTEKALKDKNGSRVKSVAVDLSEIQFKVSFNVISGPLDVSSNFESASVTLLY